METSINGLLKTITVTESSIAFSKNNGKPLLEIQLSQVTNFIFVEGTTFKYGYFTVCTSDGRGYGVNHGKAASDENSITFNSNCNDQFRLLYSRLQNEIELKSLDDLMPQVVSDSSNAGSCAVIAASVSCGHPIKICVNCGEILLEQAKRCPKCGEKGEGLRSIDSEDSQQIQAIRAAAKHEDKKSFWEKTIEEGREINRQKEAAKIAQPKPLSKKERIKENKANGVACCPKCGSTSLSANKKGFGVGKAAVGVFTVGVLGAAAGGIGSGKVVVTCLNCGHRWKV